MREHEAGRPRTPSRWHPWLKRISHAAAHISAALLLASGMASSIAARKHTNRNADHDRRDRADRDRDGGNRNREDKQANEPREDRRVERENRDRSQGDGDGDQGQRSGRHDRQADASSDTQSTARRQDATPTPTPTEDGGGRDGDGGGSGDGGGGGDQGHRAGNAGSGFFDNPLATKARRRANDFDRAGREEDEGTFADVQSDGESVYETNSVALITGPDGLEINTGNITYFAEPTPTPEPLLTLELPDREPGFPFGEDFPFGDAAISIGPATREPSDPGDTGTTTDTRAKFFPTQPEPSSDGGDNTMDFIS